MMSTVLITGGAGFVGSTLALALCRQAKAERVLAFDNLRRRGSELNVPRLRAAGVEFIHGDVRSPADLAALPRCDVLLDCAAEPSVQAGMSGSPGSVLENNLVGTLNCLELALRHSAAFLLLSTSRVYPIAPINGLPVIEETTRFRWQLPANQIGVSQWGIAESFPLDGPRSYYGASKLASELLVEEYAANHGLRALVNRCGVISGPWQMARSDQGVVALWVARHVLKQPLAYIGFGGTGKQVRDVLHVADLADLVLTQLERVASWCGEVYNVGGGPENSVSLLELTQLCRHIVGSEVSLTSQPATNPLDVRIFITDARRAEDTFSWRPRRDVATTVRDIAEWIRTHAAELANFI